MLTIIADNTMNSGSIADRQDANVVTTSMICRGLERLAARLVRVVVPVVVGAHAYCAPCPAASCQSFTGLKRWQLGLGGKQLRLMPQGHGSPAGSGRFIAG